MSATEVNSILRCAHCSKPFDKESTLKRHGYYCRSRLGVTTPKSRSCLTCAKSKARCDNKRPTCSRCTAKKFGCAYPTETANGPVRGSRLTSTDHEPAKRRRVANSSPESRPVIFSPELNFTNDLNLDNPLLEPDLVLPNFQENVPDWDDPAQTLFESLMAPASNQYSQYSVNSDLDLWTYHPNFKVAPRPPTQPMSPFSNWLSLTPDVNVRSLVVRSRPESGPQRTASLLLHTLRSYPRMMLRPNTLPPYIHPYLISPNFKSSDMESLTNCISLMHMLGSGVKGSSRLFWKNVRMECERICEEISTFGKWDLLAAMQALSIYTLVRLDEGEKDYNNFDSLLLKTVAIISKHLVLLSAEASELKRTTDVSWEDWIYEESRRRLSVVYRVVNMLVHFEPAALCDLQRDLIIAPLPTRKQLWEANDESVWKFESQSDPSAKTDFALAANGELVKLYNADLSCSGNNSHDPCYRYLDSASGGLVNWEEWCSGMDGFGGLIMLAASLIE